MNPALKRALWCRWFNRWRRAPIPPAATRIVSRRVRASCRACCLRY